MASGQKNKRGMLEKKILDLLWDHGAATVREVMVRLGSSHAYTTVMTILDRLYKKGALARQKDGQAWRYQPIASRGKVLGERMANLLDQAGGESEPLLMSFIDRAEEIDPEVLDRLEALIKKHRRGKS